MFYPNKGDKELTLIMMSRSERNKHYWSASRVICLFLTVLMILLPLAPTTQVNPLAAAQQSSTIRLVVEGNELVTDVPPIIIGGRVLVPLRAIGDALGAAVEWHAATNTVSLTRGDTRIVLRLGDARATVNGTTVMLDVSAQAIRGRTMVPLRFVGESLGFPVRWDDSTRTVTVGLGLTVENVPIVGQQGMIAAGEDYSFALRRDGTVWAWGNNSFSQLGDGTRTARLTPVQVHGLTEVTTLAVESKHKWAVRRDGTVWTWGIALFCLGDGSTANLLTPAQVQGLTEVTAIATGWEHVLALRHDGAVLAWGSNSQGQLGDGTTTNRPTPVQVQGLTEVTAVAAGSSYSLALRRDGTVWAWGSNSQGQLGDGTTTNRPTPAQVRGLTKVTAVAAGAWHNLALRRDGTVWAWGSNSGLLGDGTMIDRSTPVRVKGLTEIRVVAAGRGHNMAIRRDGTVWAWGANFQGQLGDGTRTARSTPVQVQGLTDVTTVATGYSHSLALSRDGTIWAWGSNAHGEFGDGTTTTRTIPMVVHQLTEVTAVAAGGDHNLKVYPDGMINRSIFPASHSLALKLDGTVWAWGANCQGQLGDGTVTDRFRPVQVQVLTNATAVSAGSLHSLALRRDGTVLAWGSNARGQLGDTTRATRPIPVQVQGLTEITTIAAGAQHSLALRRDGTVWAWGSNTHGQLGDGATTDRFRPVPVQLLTNVTAMSAGSFHSLALRRDGTVWTWGCNSVGQLGDGTAIDRPTPVRVLELNDIVAVSAGGIHNLALKRDGTVWAWGHNEGQIGDGTTTDRLTPVQVQGLTEVTTLAAGSLRSLALRRDGTVWAWGRNWPMLCIGEGLITNPHTPVQLQGLTEVTALAAAPFHSLVLKRDGIVWAWGINSHGQLGDGTGAQFTPVRSLFAKAAAQQSSAVVGQAAITGVTVPATGATPVTAIAETAQYTGTVTWSPLPTGGVFAPGTAYTANITLTAKPGFTLTGVGVNFFAVAGAVATNAANSGVVTAVFPATAAIINRPVMIAAGIDHMLALRQDGTVSAWGDNEYGQLGDGTTADRLIPTQVLGLTDITALAAGRNYSLALRRDGIVWSWGRHMSGELGNEFAANRTTAPVQVHGLTEVTAVAARGKHSLALRRDGTVWAWGSNWLGQLGNGTTTTSRPTPMQVHRLTEVTAVVAEFNHSFALRRDGTVWAWGANHEGQLGDGTTTNRPTPVQVQGLTDVTTIVAGRHHSFALRRDGTVWAWGANKDAQLGDGTRTARLTPVQIHGLTEVTSVATGLGHGLAIRRDGTVWAWGNNSFGQLGDGTTVERLTPVRVHGLTEIISLTAGLWNSVALRRDGTVWELGSRELRDGITFTRLMPVRVHELTEITTVVTGGQHSFALRRDGTLWAWGINQNGQLGDATTVDRLTPVVLVQWSDSQTPVSVRPAESVVLTVRERLTLAPFTTPAIWAASDSRVLKVDSSNVVTGLAPGTTNLTATTKDGLFSRNYIVRVLPSHSTYFRNSYFPQEYIELRITGDSIVFEGRTLTRNLWVWVRIEAVGGVVAQHIVEIVHGHYSGALSAPLPLGAYIVSVFMGEARVGSYTSYENAIPLERNQEGLLFPLSPVLKHNTLQQEANLSNPSEYLALTLGNRDEERAIRELAATITAGIVNDYDKVLAINNWVAANIYYDWDAYRSRNFGRTDAYGTLRSRKSVCYGYANLTVALIRAANIPSRIVIGLVIWRGFHSWETDRYTLGTHAWNEAFVNGRWVILDTTWNSSNRFENGVWTLGAIRHTYFDQTLAAFSLSHKIHYTRR